MRDFRFEALRVEGDGISSDIRLRKGMSRIASASQCDVCQGVSANAVRLELRSTYLVPNLKANPLHASAELIFRRTSMPFFLLKKLVLRRGIPNSSFNGTCSFGQRDGTGFLSMNATHKHMQVLQVYAKYCATVLVSSAKFKNSTP